MTPCAFSLRLGRQYTSDHRCSLPEDRFVRSCLFVCLFDSDHTSSSSSWLKHRRERIGGKGVRISVLLNDVMMTSQFFSSSATAGQSSPYPHCGICHVPYSYHKPPFEGQLANCLICKSVREYTHAPMLLSPLSLLPLPSLSVFFLAPSPPHSSLPLSFSSHAVPSLLLSTTEPPPELAIRGHGTLVQVRVVLQKKRLKGEDNATHISKVCFFVVCLVIFYLFACSLFLCYWFVLVCCLFLCFCFLFFVPYLVGWLVVCLFFICLLV